ncbi:MAG: amidase [Acidobacteriota bacterium]|nr:amidase [Acidobacteriota bacterium]
MKRRNFLRGTLAGTALSLAAPALSLARVNGNGREGCDDDALDGANAVAAVKPFELEEMTIAEMQEGMRSGKFTARALTRDYLERIEDVDKKGPSLNSVIETNPDALEIAESLDRGRKAGRVRGALHGIPVLIKDNIDTGDRMQTTAGSLALVGQTTPRDAFIVGRLREAGAILIGKTNLSEWANFRSTHSTSGWSGRGGQTHNPYALDRNPCGSSSGSGAATSANLCAVAVGTETDGSIVCPSSSNSLVGIKPTVGLVSRTGIIPISHTQDTAGPMARTVADAATLLGVLAGVDPRDAATTESRGKAQADYTRYLTATSLRGARIGVARKYFGFSDRVDKLMKDALDLMKREGATIVDPADIPTGSQLDDAESLVLRFEFKADLNKYLQERGTREGARTLAELIKFNEDNRVSEMPYFGQELFQQSQEKGPLTTKAYVDAVAKNHKLSRALGIDAMIRKFRLDCFIAPTGGPPWTTDLVNGDHFTGGYSTLSAVAGYPHVTVPAGYAQGLPVGISFFGAAYSEPRLISLAYSYEQASKLRRPPKFLPHAELNPNENFASAVRSSAQPLTRVRCGS